jgi:hypothetical protein
LNGCGEPCHIGNDSRWLQNNSNQVYDIMPNCISI